jgi:long-chain acyl-CoA synthetase
MTGEMKFESWRSLCDMFFDRAAELGDRPFLWAKVEGEYQSQSWAEVADQIGRLSRGLRAHGIGPGDRVGLVSENRPEWPISELAILSAGAIAVPAYVTNTVEDHLHVLTNAGVKAAIVSTRKLAENFLPAALKADSCEFVVAVEPLELTQQLAGLTILDWADVLARGADMPDDVAEVAGKVIRTDTAVIIHTSGTGGAPKGVMLSHGAIISNCMGAQNLLKEETTFGEEVFLSFLPLSHSYEHMAGQFVPISIGAQIYYAESVETLVNNMAEARPTIMTAVPRLYETMHARIVRGLAQMPNLRRKLFLKAVELGKKNYEAPGSLGFGARILDAILDKLVRKKVAQRFGGRLKFFISGGAPLNEDIGLFFTALGIRLLQGYGQTESAPLISCNPTRGYKMHTVGPPVKGVEFRIAEDGEICVRGELVMQGYYGNEAATAEVIKDGWLHTGDVGHQDEDGYIQITDRKKDIIINSGGDNISPQRIEGILTLQPEIGQAMVYGDQRPHLVALVVPDEEYLVEWAKRTGKSGRLAEAVGDGGLRQEISAAVDRVNSDLAVIERVRKFIVAGDTFTIENGLMTPSMKIRRYKIKDIYSEKLDALY